MRQKIGFTDVLIEGFGIGVRNALSLTGATILWILTIWIPYINVGTTIGMCAIPLALSKGKTISPLFIFEARYRQYMGEYFTLIGLMYIAIIPALLFMLIPGIIISIGWSLAVFIMLDKGTTPTKAMLLSNKATNGYKWIIFFVYLTVGLMSVLLSFITKDLGILGVLLNLPLNIILICIMFGCSTVFYKRLFLNSELNEDAQDVQIVN